MSSDTVPQTLASIGLKSRRFRDERAESWRALEGLLSTVERSGTKALTDSELLELPRLYRAGLSSLSVARATSLDQGVVDYLESLSERAYYALYGARRPLRERFLHYILHGWPAAVRAIWPEFLVATAIFLLAAFLGLFMVLDNPEWFYSFVGESLADVRNPTASEADLRSVIYSDKEDANGLGAFAAQLWQHNSGVAILAFALGFAFGIPTIILLVSNGLMLGAFVAIHVNKGLGMEIGGWLSIHGTTEILAIVLAGAGGLHIGRRVAFPGRLSRLRSAAASGDIGARVLGGVVIMLALAGLLEAYPRQLLDSDLWRYLIGWSLFAGWMVYFFAPRGRVSEGSR